MAMFPSSVPIECPVCDEQIRCPISAQHRGSDYVIMTVDTQTYLDHLADHEHPTRVAS